MTPQFYRKRLEQLGFDLAKEGIRHAEPVIAMKTSDYGLLYLETPRERNQRIQWLNRVARSLSGEFHIFNLNLFYLTMKWDEIMQEPMPVERIPEGRVTGRQFVICPEGWLWCISSTAGHVATELGELEARARRQVMGELSRGFVVQEEITHDGCWECDELIRGNCIGTSCVNFSYRAGNKTL